MSLPTPLARPESGTAPPGDTLAAAARFIGSEVYRGSSYGGWHPLRIPRVSTVMDLARAMGWLPRTRYLTSPRARPRALRLFHTPDYVAALQRAEASGAVSAEVRQRHNIGTSSNPVFPEIFRRPATSAGGTMLAAELVAASGGVVHVPGGGTHHAFPDSANGFCYLNDPVLCLKVLRRAGLRRIAYVDIDAHHCDGVEPAFAGDPGALEDEAGGSGFNLPVPRGLNDTEMRAILQGLILPRLAAFRPEAVVLQCGSDALQEDPLSRLCLSNNAHVEVAVALRDSAPAVVVLGGGGYNPWSVARCWTSVWAALSGQHIPERLPPAAEAVLRGIVWPKARVGLDPPEHWFTTLRDAPREGEVRPEIGERLAVLARRPDPAG